MKHSIHEVGVMITKTTRLEQEYIKIAALCIALQRGVFSDFPCISSRNRLIEPGAPRKPARPVSPVTNDKEYYNGNSTNRCSRQRAAPAAPMIRPYRRPRPAPAGRHPRPDPPILLGVALFVAVALLALFGLTAEARYLGALLIAQQPTPAVGACWV